MITTRCHVCGAEFQIQGSYIRKTCSTKCKNILISRTETGKKGSELRRQQMRENNPMTNPDTVKKMVQTRTERGSYQNCFPVRGGNGHFTKPQTVLRNLLGMEWMLEYPIPTKVPKAEHLYPTNYKVDLALPDLKLAIEVDGAGHNTKSQRSLDEKKVRFLRSIGWTVLRFTNEEIMTNSSSVISVVENCVQKLSKCMTSR